MERENIVKGTILSLTGASLWGLCAVAAKYVMGEKQVDPVWMVCLRLISAGAVLLLIALFSEKRSGGNTGSHGITDLLRDKSSWPRLLAVAVLAFDVCQVTYFAGIDYSNAGIITAIQQTAPVFVLLWTLFKEKRGPRAVEIIVLILVIFGAFMLATGGDLGALIIPLIALILGIISAITSAMYTLLPGKLMEKHGTFEAIGWGMLIGGIILIPFVQLWNVSGIWDGRTLAVFSFIVLFGTVGAFTTYLSGVSIVGPVKGSIYGLIEPVVATIASALILHQSFSITDYIGILAILGGVAALSLHRKK